MMLYAVILMCTAAAACAVFALKAGRSRKDAQASERAAEAFYRASVEKLQDAGDTLTTARLHASIRLAITDDGGTVFDLTPLGLYLLAAESSPGGLTQVYRRGSIAVHVGRAREDARMGMGA